MALPKFTAAALLAAAVSSMSMSMSMSAVAAPVVYNYTTSGFGGSVDPALWALRGASPKVTGSFIYDATSPLTVHSQDIGYEPGLAIYASGALSQLSGSVAGLSFVDRGWVEGQATAVDFLVDNLLPSAPPSLYGMVALILC